jgi:hypothetical protein
VATQGEPEHRADDDIDGSDGRRGSRLGGRVRRWWPALSVLVGALVWYPAGWAFPSSSLPPVQLLHGDAVFFGSCASALAASLVVTRWGARVVVLVVASALLWVAVTPLPDPVPPEAALVAALLVAGQLLGLLAGSLLRRGPARLAFGLALVAASTTTDRWLPLLLVGAVACAAVRAGRDARSMALAVAAAVGALAVWLVGTLAHFAVTYGWGDVRRGSGYPTQPAAAVRRVLEPASDWLRDGSGTLSGILLRQHWTTLLVAVVGGVVVGGVVWVVREEAP